MLNKKLKIIINNHVGVHSVAFSMNVIIKVINPKLF